MRAPMLSGQTQRGLIPQALQLRHIVQIGLLGEVATDGGPSCCIGTPAQSILRRIDWTFSQHLIGSGMQQIFTQSRALSQRQTEVIVGHDSG